MRLQNGGRILVRTLIIRQILEVAVSATRSMKRRLQRMVSPKATHSVLMGLTSRTGGGTILTLLVEEPVVHQNGTTPHQVPGNGAGDQELAMYLHTLL